MFNEEQLEDATLNIFEKLGYESLNGYTIDSKCYQLKSCTN